MHARIEVYTYVPIYKMTHALMNTYVHACILTFIHTYLTTYSYIHRAYIYGHLIIYIPIYCHIFCNQNTHR